MKFLLRLVVVLLVLGAVALAVAYSGWYNVAAVNRDSKLKERFLMMAMDRSVAHHARGIVAPDNLQDTAVIREGFEHFQEMCVQCHGAPGVQRSEAGEGLNPRAPKLLWAAKESSPAEIYWITKNGVKMTGMPAFGPTHDEDELWAIVAFVKQLPNLDSAGYAALQEKGCEKGVDEEMDAQKQKIDCKRSGEDCERHKMDCERQSDGTSHSPHPHHT